MRELESPLQDKKLDSIELIQEQEKKREIRLVDSQRKIRGHILWEFNECTRKLDLAKYKQQTVEIRSLNIVDLKFKNEVVINDNCYYLQALNRRNAIKHLKKIGYGNIQ